MCTYFENINFECDQVFKVSGKASCISVYLISVNRIDNDYSSNH